VHQLESASTRSEGVLLRVLHVQRYANIPVEASKHYIAATALLRPNYYIAL
jgi:hypothetical protein